MCNVYARVGNSSTTRGGVDSHKQAHTSMRQSSKLEAGQRRLVGSVSAQRSVLPQVLVAADESKSATQLSIRPPLDI